MKPTEVSGGTSSPQCFPERPQYMKYVYFKDDSEYKDAIRSGQPPKGTIWMRRDDTRQTGGRLAPAKFSRRIGRTSDTDSNTDRYSLGDYLYGEIPCSICEHSEDVQSSIVIPGRSSCPIERS